MSDVHKPNPPPSILHRLRRVELAAVTLATAGAINGLGGILEAPPLEYGAMVADVIAGSFVAAEVIAEWNRRRKEAR